MTDPTSMPDRAGEFCIAMERIMRHLMRARGWWLAALCVLSTSAFADPKPKVVDIKPFRDRLIVLTDAEGAVYIIAPGSDGKVFFGTGGKNKNVYEQAIIGSYSDGST